MLRRGDLQAIDSLILTCSGWLDQYRANSGVDPNTVGSVVQLQWFGYRISTIGDSPCGGPVCCTSTRLVRILTPNSYFYAAACVQPPIRRGDLAKICGQCTGKSLSSKELSGLRSAVRVVHSFNQKLYCTS